VIVESKPDIRKASATSKRPMEVDAVRSLVRSAQPTDAAAIARLVNAWAEAGLTLPRTIASIEQSVGEFVVVARGASIMAAGALEVHSPSIAEIRSVAVDPGAKGLGAGRDIVEFLLETLDVEEVTLLTRVPGFFAKFGFRVVSPDELQPSFIEEAISARGRTLIGRQIMARTVSSGI